MAYSVVLQKESEDQTQVSYRYGPDLRQQGLIRLDKINDKFIDVSSPNSPGAEMEYSGARKAIARAINAGEGFPDILTFHA